MIDQEDVRLHADVFRLQNLTCLKSGGAIWCSRRRLSTREVGRPAAAHRSIWNPPNAATLASDQGAAHARRIVSN